MVTQVIEKVKPNQAAVRGPEVSRKTLSPLD